MEVLAEVAADQKDSYASLPGPRALPLVGLGLFFRQQKVDYLLRLSQEYGEFVRFPLPGIRAVLVTDPDFIRMALVQSERSFYKGVIYDRAVPFIGRGLVTNQGAAWRQQRKRLNPFFRPEALEKFAGHIQASIDQTLTELGAAADAARIVTISDRMMDLTFDVVARSLFSQQLREDSKTLAKWFAEGQKYLGFRFWALLAPPLWVPTPRNLKFNRAKANLVAYVRSLIRARAQGQRKDDLLQALIEAKDSDSGSAMDEQAIIDEVLTLMVAGHDTTALTLSYCLYLLAKHPHVVQKLRAEYREVLGKRRPTQADLPKLIYTLQVLNEAMRLYPPAYSINRSASKPLTYKNYHFRADTTFLLAQYAMHRHPKYWPNPQQFIPERFAEENIRCQHPFAFFPFGGGPRTCIGNHFALQEAMLVLPAILMNFDPIDVPGKTFRLEPDVTMVPNPGVCLGFKRIAW